jgi:hypothetical protein
MSQTLIICETCRNPQCYCTCKTSLPPVRSDALLAPVIETWDSCCPSHPVGAVVRYHGVFHTVIDAGWQGFRLRANAGSGASASSPIVSTGLVGNSE